MRTLLVGKLHPNQGVLLRARIDAEGDFFFDNTNHSVFGLALGTQAATLTMSTDKATYAVGETIILTVNGDPQGATTGATTHIAAIFGSIEYPGNLVSANGGQTQRRLKQSNGITWHPAILHVDTPHANTQDSFSQFLVSSTTPIDSTRKLTAVMSFTADAPGTASFSWRTTAFPFGNPKWDTGLHFFGLTDAPGTSADIVPGSSGAIVPEPTAATLMCIGLLCLALTGHRPAP